MTSWREAYALGFVLSVFGGAALGVAFGDDSLGDNARVALFIAGYLVTGLASLLILVATIAWGVELGTRRIWDPTTIPARLTGPSSSGLEKWIAVGAAALTVVVIGGVALMLR